MEASGTARNHSLRKTEPRSRLSHKPNSLQNFHSQQNYFNALSSGSKNQRHASQTSQNRIPAIHVINQRTSHKYQAPW